MPRRQDPKARKFDPDKLEEIKRAPIKVEPGKVRRRFPRVPVTEQDIDKGLASVSIDVPLLLMPIRIETKYRFDLEPPQLRIRIYPDQINVATDDKAPTEAEVEHTKAFWAKALGERDRRVRVQYWDALGAAVGPDRAGYLARLLRPEKATGRPRFPEVETRDDDTDVPSRAVLLPRQWVAVGMRGDEEVFTVASKEVDQRPLHTSIDPTDDSFRDPNSGIPISESIAWMFDYDIAFTRGMAITVDLTRISDPKKPLSSLVVIGVTDADPRAAAGDLTELFAMHDRTAGFGFVPQGTQTNNTADDASGWVRQPTNDALDRELDDGKVGADTNAAILARALGLGEVGATTLGLAPFATDVEHRRMLDMNTVLYETVLGTYFRGLLAIGGTETIPREVLRGSRGWLGSSVVGGAPVPSFRIGPQPYGVLPVARDGDVRTTGTAKTIDDLVQTLYPTWLDSVPNVPIIDHNESDSPRGTAATDRIPAIISQDPHAGRVLTREFRTSDDPGAWWWSVPGIINFLVSAVEIVHDDLWAVFDFLGFDDWENIWGTETIDGQIEVWEQLEQLLVDGTFGLDEEQQEAGINICQQVLQQLSAWELRQRPIRSLDLPDFEGGAGRPVNNIIYGRYGSDFEEWTETAKLVGAVDGPVSPARYLEDLVARFSAESGTVPSTLGDLSEVGEPLLYQALNATEALIGGRPRAAVRDALRRLQNEPPEELARLFRESLGLATHRLDAWHTSIIDDTQRRLRKEQEDKQGGEPTGIQIGSYGVVLGLGPSDATKSSGYVLAPSLAHASTAAVLRSAWHAHGSGQAESIAAVNADSSGIRTAEWVLDGIRNGQRLGELLGYRFERRLHDLHADSAIYYVRGFVVAETEHTDATTNDPVDGLDLLALRPRLGELLSDLGQDERSAVETAVADVASVSDAVADAALLEGTHQVVQGNDARAAAVFDSLSLGTTAPPELRAPRSINAGTTVDHRVAVLMPVMNAKLGRRDLIAPEIADWVRNLVPDVSVVGLRHISSSGSITDFTLGDLELTELDAVYLSAADPTSVSPALRGIVLAALNTDSGNVVPQHASAEVPLVDFQLAANELRVVLAGARPATSASVQAAGAPEQPIDLSNRVPALKALAEVFIEAVDRDPSRCNWRVLGEFGWHRDRNVGATLHRLLKTASQLGRWLNKKLEDIDPEFVADALFVERPPLLPTFDIPADKIPYASALASPAEVNDWIDDMARVRPAIQHLSEVDFVSRMIEGRGLSWSASQVPLEPGEEWAATSVPPDSATRTCLTAVLLDGMGVGDPFVGLVIDSWSERIPSKSQVAGVTFHHDAPSNRPPQTLLLASPPAKGTWTANAIVDVVLDTLEWATVRAVAPEDVGDFGHNTPLSFVRDGVSSWPEEDDA